MAALFIFVSPVLAVGEAQKSFLRSSGSGKLFLLVPPGGSQKDSLFMLQLVGDPWTRGSQHGRLLADTIADVISDRYNCVSPEVLAWAQDAYGKMPREFQDEIRGIADGLSSRGYNFPFAKIILHATQPLIHFNFPLLVCPWNAGGRSSGSFSSSVWGRYTPSGTALAINSPDWGAVPKSLARNRVLVSVRPNVGSRYAYLGVAGVIGMSGANETGLSIAGTAGHYPITAKTPMQGNGVPIPNGFMTPFMIAAHTLRTMRGLDSEVFNRFENEVLRVNPPDGFILQLTTPSNSVLWESGGAASSDYPQNSRRMPGAWDNGTITPVDWRGDFILLPGEVLRLSTLPFPVATDFVDSKNEGYAGRAWIGGRTVWWQRMPLGRAFALPSDSGRASRFAHWFANLGLAPVAVPFAVSEDGNNGSPHIVSVLPDKSGGWWVLADGSGYGFWRRDGSSAFRAYGSDGAEACSGPLYDFGNGVTGWCRLNPETDIEWVAWTHQYLMGADNRLDGTNLSLLPKIKSWARMDAPIFGGPHTRTQFLLRELGKQNGTFTLDEFYKALQRAYFATGNENQPFGVGAYDLKWGNAAFTVSRYDGDRYVGGLSPEQKLIRLTRNQLFYE